MFFSFLGGAPYVTVQIMGMGPVKTTSIPQAGDPN